MIERDYFEHYTQFVVSHGEKIRRDITRSVSEFYTEVEVIVEIFNIGAKEHMGSVYFKEYGIGLADVVESDLFYEEAIELYRANNLNLK